ncbi:DUF4049 domain-containing protein [Escherichia coli]
MNFSAGDTYNLIKTLDVCNYDSERQVFNQSSRNNKR